MKTLASLGTVNFSSFISGKAIYKADRNATGSFEIQSLTLGGYTTQTGRESNKVALTVSGPDGELTYRLDFNDAWMEGSTQRRRYACSVVTDIARMVAVLQDKGLDYVKTLDLDSRAAASKDERELFAHIAPGKSIKVTITPGSTKNDDGLYPLQLEWA